jgi:hypothetical protein
MTDLQDSILDRLMGTSIGINWPGGPLDLAAEVVGGTIPVKFGQTDNDRGAKNEIARRLGYPVLLCEAIQGANRGVKNEDARRSLAMTLFRTLPLGGRVPKLSAQTQNRIALRLAIRAHPYVCPHPDCPALKSLVDLLAVPTITRPMAIDASGARCEAADGTIRAEASNWLTARSSRTQRVVQTAAMVLRGFEMDKSVQGWSSIRESVRLAASERGIEEAVACCIEVARLCGMTF